MMKLKAHFLVDLCVKTVIDNLSYLGDVGEMDLQLLDQIFPHCSIDHLECAEKGSQGRDLSAVTDKLWKKFYEKEFGVESLNDTVKRMKHDKSPFARSNCMRWVSLKADEAFEKIAKLYKKENAFRICTKVPPSTKRSFWGGSGPRYNVSSKRKIMKKAKVEYLKRQKNIAAIKNNSLKGSNSSPPILKTRKDLASLDPSLGYFRSTEASAKDAVSIVLCVVPHKITDLELKSPKNKLCSALTSQRNRMRSPRLERK
ncbi:hypothetical protein UlMin_037956 [Ulmus minor]